MPSPKRDSRRFAVLDPALKTRERARRAIRRLGHVPVTFGDVAELLEECGSSADGFDALLLACPEEPERAGVVISLVRKSLGSVPLILSASRRQFRDLPDLHARATDTVVVTPSTFEGVYGMWETFLRKHRISVPGRTAGWGPYRFILPLGKADVAGSEVKLRPIEFDLAVELFRNIDRPLTREWLCSAVWEKGYDPRSRSIDTNVSGLRRKLGLHTDSHGLNLQSIWGLGYQLSLAARAL